MQELKIQHHRRGQNLASIRRTKKTRSYMWAVLSDYAGGRSHLLRPHLYWQLYILSRLKSPKDDTIVFVLYIFFYSCIRAQCTCHKM
jgi:hypothetical protein